MPDKSQAPIQQGVDFDEAKFMADPAAHLAEMGMLSSRPALMRHKFSEPADGEYGVPMTMLPHMDGGPEPVVVDVAAKLAAARTLANYCLPEPTLSQALARLEADYLDKTEEMAARNTPGDNLSQQTGQPARLGSGVAYDGTGMGKGRMDRTPMMQGPVVLNMLDLPTPRQTFVERIERLREQRAQAGLGQADAVQTGSAGTEAVPAQGPAFQ